MNDFYSMFYKILEDPRCLKYYKNFIQYYKSKNKTNFIEALEKLIEETMK
jgi:thiaminase